MNPIFDYYNSLNFSSNICPFPAEVPQDFKFTRADDVKHNNLELTEKKNRTFL